MLVFYAISNLHLLNIASVKSTYFHDEEARLYIGMSDRISPRLIEGIKETKLFQNIIIIPAIEYGKIKLFAGTRYVYLFLRLIEEAVYTYKLYKYLRDDYRNSDYNQIFIHNLRFGPHIIMINYLRKFNRVFKISVIEEGGGILYTMKKQMCAVALRDRIASFLFQYIWLQPVKTEIYLKYIDDIYVYMPELYATDMNFHPLQITKLNHAASEIKYIMDMEIAGVDITEYINRRYYYISSASVMYSGSYDSTYSQLNAILSVLSGTQFLIKDHPHFTHSKKISQEYKQYTLQNVFVDQRNFLLESIFLHIDLNDKVFITQNSAVVLHPKYMFNQEPYIIFTYKLYPVDGSVFSEKMATDLRSMYQKKDKILIPETIEEMMHMLHVLSAGSDEN